MGKIGRNFGLASVACLIAACSTILGKAPEQITGKPNPETLADGTPNWTGFWIPVGGLLESVLASSTGEEAAPLSAAHDLKSDDPLDFMRSPYKEEYEELLRKESEGIPTYDPTAFCFPPGMPRMMNMTYGMEILQTPGQIAITSEWGPATRRIWLDRGDEQPPEDEREYTYAGYSLGRWDGRELIVETVGVRPDALINKSGLRHSGQMRIKERFRMIEPGVLVDEIIIDDPAIFKEPWKLVRFYRYRSDLSLKEYVCQDNNNLMAITDNQKD